MAAEISKPDFSYQWSSGGSIVAPSNVKIQTGWTAEVPPFQWENYLQNRQDNAILHLFQKGISEWDAASNYYFTTSGVRSYVQGSDGVIYVAVADSVGQNPTTDVSDTYWKVAFADNSNTLLRSNNLSDVANVTTARNNLLAAALASPIFTGVPAAPTAVAGTNTTQLATTAFAHALLPKRVFTANDSIRIPDEPGGLIIQWGKAVLTAGAGFTTISFPTAFPNACTSVVASPADNTGGATIEGEEIGPVTTSNFQAAVLTTGGAGSNTNLRWIAIGY